MFVRKLFVHVRRQVLERVLRPELAAKSAGGVLAKPRVGCPLNQGAGARKTGGEVLAKPVVGCPLNRRIKTAAL